MRPFLRMMATAACIPLLMVAGSSTPQSVAKKSRQPMTAERQVTKPTDKVEPALTPSFRKAAKLALRTLDYQSEATIGEASDYAQRRLKCHYYPTRCNTQSLRDSETWETLRRDTMRAMAAAEVEKETELDKKVFSLLRWYAIHISKYLSALENSLGTDSSKDAATTAGRTAIECSSYIGKLLDGEEVGRDPCAIVQSEKKRSATLNS